MAKILINRKKAAREFAARWFGKGYEKGECQFFWIELLQKVYNVENISDFIVFEDKVHIDHTSFIDAYIPSTHVMIEQKSLGKDLRKPIKQSDGSSLTPFQQAKRYSSELPYSSRPRWIIACNFSEFLIYDMEKPHDEPVQLLLEELPDKFECLQFMVDFKKISISPEEQISLKAGELVGKLYDALFKEYINPDENSFRSLNILCVRIVFCLYAEDAGLFETRTAFEDYIKSFSVENLRRAIQDLFKILNTKPEYRDKYDTKINSFPYTNGGLFADDNIEIPNFTKEIVDVIANYCAPFDWSEISPTIFGAVFESTLNPETRRKGGMHYTSIQNIHKVIDPLFMNDLKAEFAKIVGIQTSPLNPLSVTERGNKFRQNPLAIMERGKTAGRQGVRSDTRRKLEDFRNKLANLKFLDPACGSGNFLTETYISLRRLENECLKVVHGSQMLLSSEDFSPIKVKISQFYGIEINDFAVTVAKTALWIAESQMMKETEEIVERNLDFLPLSTSATIVEGNALSMDWRYLHEEAEIPTIKAKKTNLIYPMMVMEKEVEYGEINLVTNEISVGKAHLKQEANHYDYIMGNPPFVGYSYQSAEQKRDVLSVFVDEHGKAYKAAGKIDYVSSWYFKAAELIRGTKTKCAFVSTNSITQGEQVASVWKPIFERFNISFDFAWRTFRWDSESNQKAHVHCVIIGFSYNSELNKESVSKRIFIADGSFIEAENINCYLIDSPDIFIESRLTPLCTVPPMTTGNRPADGGHLIIEANEYDDFIKKEPGAAKYMKNLLGSEEFINNKKRYCLWLVNASPAQIKGMKEVYRRVEACKADRESSPDAGRRKLAETPHLFRETNNPEYFLLLPKVSSERRRYVPIGFFDGETISTDLNFVVPNATLYHFGVLTSSVHNAWMRAVCGRLKSDYRYSKDIVYNNFPWCNPTETQKNKIEQTARAILDAREKYPDSSLADLYDETTMPPDLRRAHQENDKAVLAAYGFSPKMTESEIVAELFKMYEKLTIAL